MEFLTIGALARQAGVRPSAIRYYEQEGILPAPARVGGRRRYGDSALWLLKGVLLARRLGFTIEDIRLLFQGASAEAPWPPAWNSLVQQKLAEVEESIARATALRKLLLASLECGCVRLEECRLILR
jgi:MerR family transcriptional regulator, redox-sensitive transcriptional activator SoxR